MRRTNALDVSGLTSSCCRTRERSTRQTTQPTFELTKDDYLLIEGACGTLPLVVVKELIDSGLFDFKDDIWAEES